MHRKTSKRDYWEIPGGGIDDGETAQQAAAREVMEELGLHVQIEREIGHRHFSFADESTPIYYTWFRATVISGEPKILEPDTHCEFGYFTPAQITSMYDKLSPNAQNFIDALNSESVVL